MIFSHPIKQNSVTATRFNTLVNHIHTSSCPTGKYLVHMKRFHADVNHLIVKIQVQLCQVLSEIKWEILVAPLWKYLIQ